MGPRHANADSMVGEGYLVSGLGDMCGRQEARREQCPRRLHSRREEVL